MKTWVTLLLIVGIVVVLGVSTSSDPGSETSVATEATAPVEEPPAAEVPPARPTILDFGRGYCAPCKKMMPVLDALRERYAGVVEVTYVDMDAPGSDAMVDRYDISLIPTQVFLDAEGEELYRHQGFIPLEDIELRLREFGWISSR